VICDRAGDTALAVLRDVAQTTLKPPDYAVRRRAAV